MPQPTQLTEEQIELIAEKAAEKALERVYAQVGKGVVNKFLWMIGVAAVSFVIWLGNDHFGG